MNPTILRSRRFFSLALAAALLAASLMATPAVAQVLFGGQPSPASPASVSDQLAAQSQVRVAGPWGSAILYRPQLIDHALDYEALSEYTPTSSDSPELARPLSMSEVATIEQPGSSSRTGLAIGAVLGAVAGMALGIGLAHSSTGPSASFNTGGETLGGGLAGAMFGCAVGGAIGALVGSRVPSWQVMYARTK